MNPVVTMHLRHAAILLVLVVLQIAVGGLVSIGGVTPDLVLIGLVYVGIRSGRIPATVAGFTAGLLLDLYAGEVIGISALAKTVAGFAAGFAFDEEKAELLVRNLRFVLVALGCAALHNTVFLFAYLQTTDVHILEIVLLHGLGSTVYTAMLSAIPPLILSRTGSRLRV